MKKGWILLLLLVGCDIYYGQEPDGTGGQIFSARGNQQRITEDIVGVWLLQSVIIRTDSGRTITVSGDCVNKYKSNPVYGIETNRFNFDLHFGVSGEIVTQYFNCTDESLVSRFRIIESHGRVYLSLSLLYSNDYEFTDAPYYISQTMTLSAVVLPKGISSAVFEFNRSM